MKTIYCVLNLHATDWDGSVRNSPDLALAIVA
jgi:hypothetical protein